MAGPRPEDAERFRQWYSSLGLKLACPACQKSGWELIGDLIIPIAQPPHDGDSVLVRPLMCSYCGLLSLFAAMPSGPNSNGGES